MSPWDHCLCVPRTVVHMSVVWWSLHPCSHSLCIPVCAGAVPMRVVFVSPGLSPCVPVPQDVAGNSLLAAARPEKPGPEPQAVPPWGWSLSQSLNLGCVGDPCGSCWGWTWGRWAACRAG